MNANGTPKGESMLANYESHITFKNSEHFLNKENSSESNHSLVIPTTTLNSFNKRNIYHQENNFLVTDNIEDVKLD